MSVHERMMRAALLEAQLAAAEGEIPVGAVVARGERIVSQAHNTRELSRDPTAHAELVALRAAAQALGTRRLDDCTLYVTLEPCVMCAGASFWTQIPRIVYGASDEKRGYTTIAQGVIHKKTQIKKGVLEEECSTLLKDFFKKKRK